ncbi:helix-turn-helix domain-containing protein [Halovivax limisalsi]|uniref:helix-turn-helix domain-containing protein n=1 Tax=Halovivax limisalsi TaxID=1453760 RepID=UPI001FFD5DFF|nr:SMC-Scp complex subunit ScpB [Halovivax limisalsi]
MEHLEDLSVADLQSALDEADGAKPAQRLVAAIAYKHGITQTELSTWFDVERKTIYNWLSRLEEDELVRAVEDRERPGRPRKLDADEHEAFVETVRSPPTEAGYDGDTWTPELVQTLLADRFDVDYSLPSCRRLMNEAGLTFRRTYAPGEAEEAGRTNADRRGGHWIPE